MKKATVNEDYCFLAMNDDAQIVSSDLEDVASYAEQEEGDVLEVWKKREDGHVFVYSDEFGVGYWVHPRLITIND